METHLCLTLRPISIEDCAAIYAHISSQSTYFSNMYRWPSPYQEHDAQEFVERALKEMEAERGWHWAIIVEELCGVISLYDIVGDGTAQLGYWVAKGHSGKGIASEALRQVLKMREVRRKIRAISTRVLEDNIASIKVLEKYGFIVNKNKSRSVVVAGKPKNELLYVLYLDR